MSERKKYLVTGGAGYVGSVVAQHLLEAGHTVTVLDDLSTGFRAGVPAGATFVEGRIQDAARHLDPSFDGVLHFAAYSQVGESVVDPEKYWVNNVGGTTALLAAMREHGVRTLVFSSTAATYGEPVSSPITETDPTAPTSPYGASKLAVDHMISGEATAHGLAAVSLRYFNVAGAYGSCGERHTPESHLIPLVLQVALGKRESISVYGDDYPTPTAPASATTSTSPTSPRPTSSPWTRPPPASTSSATSATATASRSARSSRPSARSPATPSPRPRLRAAAATRPSSSPPPPPPSNASAGSRPAPTWPESSPTPGSSPAERRPPPHDRER